MTRLKAPALRMGIGSIPADREGFDIDGVVADIMTTVLDMAQERQGPHPFRYEDVITFSLEESLGFDPRIVAELIRELIDRPHELPVEPFPQAVEVLSRLAGEIPLVFVTARDRPEPIQLWLNRALASVPPAPSGSWPPATRTPSCTISGPTPSSISWKTPWKPASTWRGPASPPIVFALPWNRKPHPFLEVAGWPDLARLLFEDKGEGG